VFPKHLKGTISGAFYFFWGAGFFFGPLLLGKMGLSGYWQMGFMSLAGLFMIELITCFMVVKSLSKAVSINCSH
jgi:MFS family permease